ncbi:MAG: peptide ABC transporter substrate-binding protein [Dehalococcoidia bacterium]|nr:peptide ABC transporter substrate-binding protein [Dehalococcoidia bacterium]
MANDIPAGKVAYMALVEGLDTLNPSMIKEGTVTDAVARVVFAGLFRFTADGVAPDLVDSWTASPDGLTQTYLLKEGLKWSDGMPVTAHDAAFGILNSLAPNSPSPDAGLLASVILGGELFQAGERPLAEVGVTAVDDLTLVIETTVPAAFLRSILARPSAFPQPRHVATLDQDWSDRADLVSNGPFRVVNRLAGGNLVLVRNPFYDGPGGTGLDGIVFLNTPVSAAIESVEAGIVNAIFGMSPPRSPAAATLAPNTAVEVMPGRVTYSLRFDVSQPPFDDVFARRAFGEALDREALVEEAVPGSVQVATVLVPRATSNVASHAPSGSDTGVEYDPQHARDLLASAGYRNARSLESFSLLYDREEEGRPFAEAVAGFWSEVFGMDVSVRGSGRVDGIWSPATGPAVWIERHEGPYLDADAWLRLLYRSDSDLNVGGYAEPAFDAAVDQGGAFTDPEDRARAYRGAERILVEIDVAVVPLYVEDTYRWLQDGLAEEFGPGGMILIESWDLP